MKCFSMLLGDEPSLVVNTPAWWISADPEKLQTPCCQKHSARCKVPDNREAGGYDRDLELYPFVLFCFYVYWSSSSSTPISTTPKGSFSLVFVTNGSHLSLAL